jgi:hypothetical protein
MGRARKSAEKAAGIARGQLFKVLKLKDLL